MQAEKIAAEASAVRLNAMNRNNRLDALTTLPRGESSASLMVMFRGEGEERLFQEEDAAFALQLANLPASGHLPIAFVDGQLRGADLAVALFCPWIILGPGASLGSGFGRPGSSAVYVAAARRPTLLSVAKANLVTWPMTRQAMFALVDPLDAAVKQPV